MSIPGVGPLTSLYLVRTLGPIKRFAGMRQVVSYVGLDSVERSSDNPNKRRRYGKISKQGDRMPDTLPALRDRALSSRF